MARPINVPIKLRVTFDAAGNPQVAAAGGGAAGGGGPAAVGNAGPPLPPGMAPGGIPTGAPMGMGQMGTQNRIALGGAGIPWWLDPSTSLGSSMRAMTSAMTNPLLSGGEQTATMAAQSARLGLAAFGRTAPGRAQAAALAGSPTADTDAIWDALADSVAAAIEKGFQEVSTVSAQTNQQVGDVAARFARAGVEIDDDRLTGLAERMQTLNRAEYRARVRAADVTGNVSAKMIGEAQAAIGDLINPIDNGNVNGTVSKMLGDMMSGQHKATQGQLGGS